MKKRLFLLLVLTATAYGAGPTLPPWVVPFVEQSQQNFGASGLPAGITFIAPTFTVSTVGSGNGVLALSGTTSGTATFTAPSIAGTATNPVLASNSMTWASGDVLGWNTGGADTGISRDSAGVLDFGNGTAGNKSAQINAATGIFTGFLGAANTQRLTADATPIAATTPGTAFLTWPALAINTNYSFHCEILYTQQTAAGGIGLAIQAATNAPTRLDAWGNIFTSNAGVAAEGNLANLASTTATPVVGPATPSATGTVFQATLNGTIQVGALSPTLSVLMFTGSGADTVTPKAGSFCAITP